MKVTCEQEQKGGRQSKVSEKIVLKISNLSKDLTYQLEIEDNAYGDKLTIKKASPSGEVSIVLDQKKSHGWYDFSIRVKGYESFSIRYAGRIETGKETYSDPQMGKA